MVGTSKDLHRVLSLSMSLGQRGGPPSGGRGAVAMRWRSPIRTMKQALIILLGASGFDEIIAQGATQLCSWDSWLLKIDGWASTEAREAREMSR